MSDPARKAAMKVQEARELLREAALILRKLDGLEWTAQQAGKAYGYCGAAMIALRNEDREAWRWAINNVD